MDDSEYAKLLRSTMVNLTEAASHPTALELTLHGATKSCVELIAGAHSADILTITGATITSR